MTSLEREPRIKQLPDPGDGRYIEQVKRNGEYCYVFYTPETLNPVKNPEHLNYDTWYQGPQDDNRNVHYIPQAVLPYPDFGEPLIPEPDLWFQIYEYIYSHVELPDSRLYHVLTSWVYFTYLPEPFEVAPYIRFIGVRNTGKTRGLEVLWQLAYRAMLTPDATDAALFRLIEDWKITYLLDESEIYQQENKSSIQNILNSGYRRGQTIPRAKANEVGGFTMEFFRPFGPKAIAGIEELKSTLESRTIRIQMERNTRDVRYLLDKNKSHLLRSQLLYWRFRRLHDLEMMINDSCDSGDSCALEVPPEGIRDIPDGRLIEIYSPLVQIAQVWGGMDIAEEIVSYAKEQYTYNQDVEAGSIEAEILRAILRCENQLQSGKFATQWVKEYFNENRGDNEKWGSQSVGRKIRSMGFKPKPMTGGNAGYVWDSKRIQRLCERYNTPYTPTHQLSQLTQPAQPEIEKILQDAEQFTGLELLEFHSKMNGLGYHSNDVDRIVLAKGTGFKVADNNRVYFEEDL